MMCRPEWGARAVSVFARPANRCRSILPTGPVGNRPGLFPSRRSAGDGPSQRIHRQFWDGYFAEHYRNFGTANADSHEDNIWCINDSCIRWCCYSSNLLGDPQTPIRGWSEDPVLRFERLTESESAGNGDGVINPGESVELLVTVRNLGLEAATGVSGQLTVDDANGQAYVQVLDGVAAFPTVPGVSGTAQALDAFGVQVSSSCPVPRTLRFDLALQDDEDLVGLVDVPLALVRDGVRRELGHAAVRDGAALQMLLGAGRTLGVGRRVDAKDAHAFLPAPE